MLLKLQKPKKKGQNKTYRNSCEPCRSKKQWAYIKSDIKRYEKVSLRAKTWAATSDGKRYYEEYRKQRHKYEYKNITPQ